MKQMKGGAQFGLSEHVVGALRSRALEDAALDEPITGEALLSAVGLMRRRSALGADGFAAAELKVLPARAFVRIADILARAVVECTFLAQL